jgi:protease secretion system membrane fusion protein
VVWTSIIAAFREWAGWCWPSGFGGFMLWAALAPLDQGVPASGQVVVTGNRKTVQNLGPGMVEAILVKDGDEVSKGDVLLRLDPTTARSQYQVTHSQWLVAKATEARLLADVAGPFGDRLSRRSVEATRTIRGRPMRWPCRRSCLRSRQAGLQAELGAMKNMLAGLQSSPRVWRRPGGLERGTVAGCCLKN